MNSRKMKTSLGTFNVFERIVDNEVATIICFPAMGINNAYFDNYYLYESLNDYDFNIISVDMLGQGYSSNPLNTDRNLENISQEIKEVINNISADNRILLFHSFTSMYLLNVIDDVDLAGAIFIDPTIPSVIFNNPDDINQMINDAKNPEEVEADVNPLLPENLKNKASELYNMKSGDDFEINELENATDTSEKLLNSTIDDKMPVLNILSTLNIELYKKNGNPYFNKNRNSIEMVLNGHHFIQWQHPEYIASAINMFITRIIK